MASNKAVALAMAIVILASALASMGRPVPVAADLGDGHTTTVPAYTFDSSDRPQGRITRNLVKGESLVVCSTDFPEATKTAIDRWNDALSHEVLTFEADSTKCQSASSSATWNPEKGVVAVFVSVGTVANDGRIQGSVLPADRKYTCPSTAAACVRQDDVGKGDVWRTRFGRLEVIVNPGRYRNWPDGRLEYLITHELGHALSLGDYFCNYRDDDGNPHPDFIDELTIMNTRSFWSDQESQACNPPGGIPADRDVEDYEEVYTPAAVTDFSGTAQRQTVILTWKQSDVFVESDFEIQRQEGAIWVVAATPGVNAESFRLVQQPAGVQRYRIVARTMALPEKERGHGHTHGTLSAVIEVAVPLTAPTRLRVTGRMSSSLTLTWNTVSGADRYELRRTPSDTNCNGDVQATVTTTSHLFRGLDANTQYRLCVRSVRTVAKGFDLRSTWAQTLATTERPPRPMDRVFTLPPVHDTETRWIVVFVPPFGQCNEFEEQRTKSTTVTIHLVYRWGETGWVARAYQSESVLYSPWRRTGKAKVCEVPIRDGAWLLSAGEYELRWAAQQIRFTVPEDGQVELRSRRLDSGEDAAVFSVVGGAELVVTPDMLAEDAVTGLAGTSDPTLAALSSSLELAQADSTQPTPATETPCAEVAKPEIGAMEVDLAGEACAIVRGGGAINVSGGTGTLNLSLPTERDWLALAARQSAESDADAFWFIDLATGGWIVLNPATGSELERHAPADATGLPALLDAIATSASTPATE